MRVAIATCQRIPEPDRDEPLLLTALAAAGVDARVLAWDDEEAPFAEHDVVVLRSTWNYYQRVGNFVAWALRTGENTRVLNPPAIVSWNARKTYLTDLEKRGIEIVPTEFVLRGPARSVRDILDARGWDEVVIKPVVSAGSFRTERFSRSALADAQAFLDALVVNRDAMVQRWMPSGRDVRRAFARMD